MQWADEWLMLTLVSKISILLISGVNIVQECAWKVTSILKIKIYSFKTEPANEMNQLSILCMHGSYIGECIQLVKILLIILGTGKRAEISNKSTKDLKLLEHILVL
jgi:hypothetical protein